MMKMGAITQCMATTMGFFLILILTVFFHLPTISEATEMTTMMMMIPHAGNASSSSSIGELDADNYKKELLLIDSEGTYQRRFLLNQPAISPATLLADKAVCYTGPGNGYLSNCGAKSGYPRNTHPCLKYYLCRN